jgi:predicted DCC family thiol-disulfide oxidoreductase YuxK
MQTGDTPAVESEHPRSAADEGSTLTVVYDGDCPVCTTYSCNLPLAGPNRIVNARQGGKLVDELTTAGLDLDDGMVVIHEGRYYHGADAVHMMALHSKAEGWLARLNQLVFRSRARSRALYPTLRFGRNLLLRILGKTRINNLHRG